MITEERSLTHRLMDLYRGGAPAPTFDDVLRGMSLDCDSDLADLIEADGRRRIQLEMPVELERYLDAVPDLAERPEALDAAIDMTLRAAARTAPADGDAVAQLVAAHPGLTRAIRECATLSNAIWSTGRIRGEFSQWAARELPCEFGPPIEDGRLRYELTELLGEGAFGQVFLATDRQLSEADHAALVSIKIMPSRSRSALGRQKLVDEATKARRIDHPNVVRVLDRGLSRDDENFVVYEYVAGGDLGKRVRRLGPGVVPRDEAVRLCAQMARGVHAAHMAGLVHCDLKPNNIVITEDGEPKVADFGIAIRWNPDTATRAPDGRAEPVGNLAFMSPEQYRMEPSALTIPTDVYALGGILFWLITGALPNGSTPDEIRAAHDPDHGRRIPPSLRGHGVDVDHDLDGICRRAMAIRPEDRHSSAALLADDLEAWTRHEPITWMHPSPARKARLWARRKPALAAACAVAAILAVGGAAAMWRAAVAQTVADAKELARAEAAQMMLDHIDQARRVREENIRYEVLPDIWLAEWVMGPHVLAANDADRIRLWQARKDTIRDLLSAAGATGRADHLEALNWESSLAFWLTVDGEYEEAEPILRRNLASWSAHLSPDDDWLGTLRAMSASAAVSRLAAARAAAPLDAAARAEAESAFQKLMDADAHCTTLAPGSPIHRLVLARLATLYTDVLDRSADGKAIAARLEALDK